MNVGAYFTTPEERAIILGETEPPPEPVVIPDPVSSYLPANGTVSTWRNTTETLNATMTGSPSYSPSIGYTFNGSTQYGRIASTPGINDFDITDTYSVEVWFNPSSGQLGILGDTPGIVEKWNSTNQQRYPYIFRYRETNTSAIIAAYDGTTFANLTISNVPTNTWVQVVGVFDFTNNILIGYKNGVSASTASLASLGTVSNTSAVGIAQRISVNGTTAEKLFKGSIGMVRFYNTALSTEQVSQLFTNTRDIFGI